MFDSIYGYDSTSLVVELSIWTFHIYLGSNFEFFKIWGHFATLGEFRIGVGSIYLNKKLDNFLSDADVLLNFYCMEKWEYTS